MGGYANDMSVQKLLGMPIFYYRKNNNKVFVSTKNELVLLETYKTGSVVEAIKIRLSNMKLDFKNVVKKE